MPITNLFLLPGDRLSPCPFCGGTALELQNTHTACYWIKCLDVDCGAEVLGESFTGNYRSENIPRKRHEQAKVSAIAAWNRRSTLAAPDDAVGKVVAEVVAEHERIASLGPWDPMEHWSAICTEVDSAPVGVPATRERLIRVMGEAIAGILACDAAKGGA